MFRICDDMECSAGFSGPGWSPKAIRSFQPVIDLHMFHFSRHLTALVSLLFLSSESYSNIEYEYWEGGIDHSFLDVEAFPLMPVHFSKGEAHAVVSGRNGRVVVEKRDGIRATVGNPKLSLLKGRQFAGGIVRVSESSVNRDDRMLRETSASAGYFSKEFRESRTGISMTLLPSEDYENVILGMLFFDGRGGSELFIQNIGTLEAGNQRAVSFHVPVAYDTSRVSVNYAVLLFNHEGEIVTDGRREMTPLLNTMFESVYSELVYAYQENNANENVPVSLVQKYPLVADVDQTGLVDRSPVYFTLTVSSRGFVDGITASRELSDDVYAACERSFREWLFLPKLENGYPSPSRVRIPVTLAD